MRQPPVEVQSEYVSDDTEEEEVVLDEDALTIEQQSFVADKIAYCTKNIAVLKAEEV